MSEAIVDAKAQVPETPTTALNTSAEIVVSPEIQALRAENAALKEKMTHCVEMNLEYQSTIDQPLLSPAQLYGQACSGDQITLETFMKQWQENIKANCEKFDVDNNGVMEVYGKLAYRPCICAGSGPSLKKNAQELTKRSGIGLVSCLHNFGFLEDLGAPADYYVTLDSQDLCIGEMSQGGTKDAEYYWDLTKDRTLVASLVTSPKLAQKWKGKILWFVPTVPDPSFLTVLRQYTKLNCSFNTGGNALGASYYFARAVLGAGVLAFAGADFSFSYTTKFHSWDSPYDVGVGGTIRVMDIFGNCVKTWGSYNNFALFLQYIALGGRGQNPCLMVNCTEGGILGAYPNGNIKQIIQMRLCEFIYIFTQHELMPKMLENKNQFSFLF
jgi:hypothetical protein